MPRIRSIKPEFWTDGTNKRLSSDCALFFIGLWNFCDDEGKYQLDLDQLAAQLGGRWHRGKVRLFLSCLLKSGQLRANSDSTWVQVTGWSHQKIDKPKQPEIKASELQWLSKSDSSTALDHSRPIDARIGSDRIGSDRIGSTAPKSKSPKSASPVAVAPALGQELVAHYCEVYKTRYHESPVLRPQDTKALKTLGESAGAPKVKALLAAYIRMNNSWFVTKSHDLATFLSNLNQIQNFSMSGQIVTAADARSAEAGDSLKNQIERLTGEGA